MKIRWPTRRGWRRTGITLASIVGVYAVLVGLIAPPIARSVAEKKLSAALHRRTTIAKIVVNPFTLALTVRGFAVRDRDGGPFVAFDELYVNVQLMSILRRGAVVREVTLLRPAITLARETPQRYSISDLLESEPSPPPPPKQESSPTRYSINNIRILEGSIDFIDRPMRRPIRCAISRSRYRSSPTFPTTSSRTCSRRFRRRSTAPWSVSAVAPSLQPRSRHTDRSRRARAFAGALLRIRARAAAIHAALGGARRRADGAVRAARLGEADADAVGPRVAQERGVARSRRRAAVRARRSSPVRGDRAVGAAGGTADAGTRPGRFADGVGAAAAQRAHEPRRPHARTDAGRVGAPGLVDAGRRRDIQGQ